MQHLPHENSVSGAPPLQNPVATLGRPPPRGPKSGPARGAENEENRLPALLGRSGVALVLWLVVLCCSWLLLAASAASEKPPGSILGAMLAQKTLLLDVVLVSPRGLFSVTFLSLFLPRFCSKDRV